MQLEPFSEDELFLHQSAIFYEALREPDWDGPLWGLWDSDNPGDPGPDWGYYLNLNDSFACASADSQFVPKDAIPELARLVRAYGPDSGALYWAARIRGYDPQIEKNKVKVAQVRFAEKVREIAAETNTRYAEILQTLAAWESSYKPIDKPVEL